MAQPRARSFVRTRAPKRKTVWIGTATGVQVTVGSGLSVIHSSFNPAALSILAGTVVRVRGLAQFFMTAFGVDRTIHGAYGLAVVSDEAFAAGAGSIPRPHDDDDWPGWLVHGYYSAHLQFQSATSELVFPHQYVIDSKAMRKVGPNETLVWVVEDNSSTSTQAVIQARVLIKLS